MQVAGGERESLKEGGMDVLVMLEEGSDHSAVLAHVNSVPSPLDAERPSRDVVTLYGAPSPESLALVLAAAVESHRSGEERGDAIRHLGVWPERGAIGDAAPRSENPTTATAPAKELSTARPPNVKLLRYSVADSLERRLPFVLAFATPSFCESRTCGPTLEVVEAVRRRFESRGIRFIHVEIYEDNLPGNGVNRWVEEWKLPTEPWVFVVDRSGVVRDRFEGAVSVGELASSVEQNLLGA